MWMKELDLESLLADKRNLEQILDNLMEGIIAHDKGRRILFFNRAAETITGFRKEEVIGRDCHEVLGGPFCGSRCAFCGESPNSLTHTSYPLNILTKSGETRRIEMSVTGMTDEKGCFVGVLAAFRDMTDLIGLRTRLGELTSFAGIIGRDQKMLKIFGEIQDLATNDFTVHISGETGTGKELVAAAIHHESHRSGGPFVPVNCGALPEGLLESELFGHVKGAFSGAIRDKKGRFELAHGGTIFFDEVSDLPKPMQVKLLRVLQGGTFERVGGEKTITVDVRVISAANRDLKREMERQNFREDLYYRLNVVPVRLPALRERKNDVPLLVAHFLEEAAGRGQGSKGLSKDAVALMMNYSWPGNVRELRNAIHFALVTSRGGVIYPENLPLELRKNAFANTKPRLSEKLEADEAIATLKESGAAKPEPARRLDRYLVIAALKEAGGNKSKAARLLGVSRATLYRFLEDMQGVS
jgi:sigma-54 dependent transcriptional regulator, acetoin dehydrogenase operon transcriptional activator AcoR